MSSSAPAAPAGEAPALARDRLGIPAVLFFILSAMAPMTVVAGVVTTMYAVTGLSAIGAAFVAVALELAVFAVGYVARCGRWRRGCWSRPLACSGST
jgi:hypothetical protein